MLPSYLDYASLLSVILASLAATVGAVKAAPLVPSSAPHIRELTEILNDHLHCMRGFVTAFAGRLREVGTLDGPWHPSEQSPITHAEEYVDAQYRRLSGGVSLGVSDQANRAAEARLWILSGAILAMVSAACQIVNLALGGPSC